MKKLKKQSSILTHIHSHQLKQRHCLKSFKECEITISSSVTGQISKISPLEANHGAASWVTKLMESLNKWLTT